MIKQLKLKKTKKKSLSWPAALENNKNPCINVQSNIRLGS